MSSEYLEPIEPDSFIRFWMDLGSCGLVLYVVNMLPYLRNGAPRSMQEVKRGHKETPHAHGVLPHS